MSRVHDPVELTLKNGGRGFGSVRVGASLPHLSKCKPHRAEQPARGITIQPGLSLVIMSRWPGGVVHMPIDDPDITILGNRIM
ncbi:TPA: hypothetical protein QDC03_007768 [Burkholderia cepacia]|uniref:hypothetical protein n=1 Tax=Burkholderia cepacia complex TaxID=87882 RepID=UPI0011B1D4F1|nr:MULTISPECIES: hypothetical protein [Burkholderia cepacia complex]UOB60345.1 hypothetical protein MRS60_30690 [Burkholderia pyrrocinia]HDR9510958.1 hypothetical protein [Burkholderia cepacia]HDR9512466.1 hypothetical protein [Burkholderia cepacia]